MTPLPRRLVLGLLAAGAVARSGRSQPRMIVDSVGRRIAVPGPVSRVMAAGPPASVLLYALAPEAMVGWVPVPPTEARPFLLPSVRDLAASGRLTGRAGAVDADHIASLSPDLIVDFGSVGQPYRELADKVQGTTRVPYALIDGRIDNSPAALRLAGDLLGRQPRAEALARYAEQSLARVDAILVRTPTEKRPKVYVARGPEGLLTAARGSGLTEIVERAGAVNVAEGPGQPGGAFETTLERVAEWNPDIILAFDRPAREAIRSRPAWRGLRAVAERRVYAAPTLPWGWLGEPPSINRLIGLRWLPAVLYRTEPRLDVPAEAKAFHRLFYGVAPSDAELSGLLEGAL
jgi:iron complex transport system substrate-binding protein